MPRLHLLLLTFYLFVGLLLIYSFRETSSQKLDNNSYQFLRTNIKKIISRSGIKNTTLRIETAFKNGLIDINGCHSLLHWVGHAAYELHPKNIDDFISLSGDVCLYGFQHGVEAQIALEKLYDLELMRQDLSDYCKKVQKKHKGTLCYHGAGHAFIQNLQPIKVALENCDKIVGDDNPEDCYRGAFSEYGNMLRGIDGDTDAPIPGKVSVQIEKNHEYDECFKLPSKYQQACVAQFISFFYDGDLDSSLAPCNRFNSWVGNVCASKVTENYTSKYRKDDQILIPKSMSKLNNFVREGYITGTINSYVHLSIENPLENLNIWCSQLTAPGDKEYCFININ